MRGTPLSAIDHLDLGDLREVELSGWAIPSRVGILLEVQRPSGPEGERTTVRLADMLTDDPPCRPSAEWLRHHPRERRLLRDLTVLGRAAAWLATNDPVTDPPFHTAVGAQLALLSLPSEWPSPHLARQAAKIRQQIEDRLERAHQRASDVWADTGPAVWQLAREQGAPPAAWLPRLAERALTGGRLSRGDRSRVEGAAERAPRGRRQSRTIEVPATAGRRLADLPVGPTAVDVVDALLVETTTPWWTWSDEDPTVGRWTVRVPGWCADLVEAVHTPEVMGLTVAGRPIDDAAELVARYCGVTGETWAYPYFDRTPVDPSGPNRVDIALVGLMHGPIRRTDLEWYEARLPDFRAAVEALPTDLALADVPPNELAAISGLVEQLGAGSPSRRSIASKVLHRHRPALVPIEDRDIARRYAQATGAKGRLAYTDLVLAIAADLLAPANRSALTAVRERVGEPHLTDLRALDIAVWMDQHGRRSD